MTMINKHAIYQNKSTWYVKTHNWSMQVIKTKKHGMPECVWLMQKYINYLNKNTWAMYKFYKYVDTN